MVCVCSLPPHLPPSWIWIHNLCMRIIIIQMCACVYVCAATLPPSFDGWMPAKSPQWLSRGTQGWSDGAIDSTGKCSWVSLWFWHENLLEIYEANLYVELKIPKTKNIRNKHKTTKQRTQPQTAKWTLHKTKMTTTNNQVSNRMQLGGGGDCDGGGP